jgi:hypothetical protein
MIQACRLRLCWNVILEAASLVYMVWAAPRRGRLEAKEGEQMNEREESLSERM